MRAPNPWIAVPALAAAAFGAVVGFQVTRISCAPGTCLGASLAVAVGAAAAALLGVGTVVVLAARSMAEWRRHQESAGRHHPADGDPPAGGEPPQNEA
jgi:hypothetical protein